MKAEKFQRMASINWLRMGLLLVFIAVPLANFLLPPILSDGNQFADDPQIRIAAAGYAFAIWGIIFAGMLYFSAYLMFGNEPDSSDMRQAICCLMIAGGASIAFVPISIYLSSTIGWVDLMVHLIALTLATIYLRRHVAAFPISKLSRWSFFGPSMYFGWISAATVISTSLLANEWGIELGESAATLTAITTVIGLGVIAIWMILGRDPIYGATVCWALVAVGVKQSAFPSIRYSAWAVAAVIGAMLAYALLRKEQPFYALRKG